MLPAQASSIFFNIYKKNQFRRTCDFSIERITTLDFQWIVSHHLKRLLRLNINWNKIVNIQTKLNVLIISPFDNFVTKYHYINPLELS